MRHVSDLRKNFLSLRAFKAKGYKFSGTDGVLKVTKGSMTVPKEDRTVNFYNVIRSVEIGDASVAKEKDDTTRLWDMRLRHLSERGL